MFDFSNRTNKVGWREYIYIYIYIFLCSVSFGFVTIYIHHVLFLYLMIMYVFHSLSHMCCFFSLFKHMFLDYLTCHYFHMTRHLCFLQKFHTQHAYSLLILILLYKYNVIWPFKVTPVLV